jgi:hypothetical protein
MAGMGLSVTLMEFLLQIFELFSEAPDLALVMDEQPDLAGDDLLPQTVDAAEGAWPVRYPAPILP